MSHVRTSKGGTGLAPSSLKTTSMGYLLQSRQHPDWQRALATDPLRVGRAADKNVVLPDPSVSRHHAVFQIDAGTLMVTDLNSTNGTYVNGRRIEGRVIISPGDSIRVGKFEWRIVSCAPEPARAPALEPVPLQMAAAGGEAAGPTRVLTPRRIGGGIAGCLVVVITACFLLAIGLSAYQVNAGRRVARANATQESFAERLATCYNRCRPL